MRCDAVVIGGGHNGLAAANYLARAGKPDRVVEARPVVGGGATGVRLAGGEVIDAELVLSNAEPGRTLGRLLAKGTPAPAVKAEADRHVARSKLFRGATRFFSKVKK